MENVNTLIYLDFCFNSKYSTYILKLKHYLILTKPFDFILTLSCILRKDFFVWQIKLIFVDKSMFIKHVNNNYDNDSNKFMYIIRPYHFSKIIY